MSDGWVRVEDGLPERDGFVWVAEPPFERVYLAQWRNAEWPRCWRSEIDVTDWYEGWRNITHWRYADVPEPPTGE